ncbi:MAG: hypothetical protein ABS81_27635 [Pseudonocardia sp. SCN 72-86]|nr:MAG: hypothetical protein ABS81_27635 [Pseudonocardia sp. SCN 72-86]
MTGITERLADAVGNVWLTGARVVELTRPGADFVRLVVQDDAFRSASWTPGGKVQFRPRRGTFQLRTYTPTRWDTGRGAFELVAFTHGDGPGSDWFRTAAEGDPFEVSTPRKSVDLQASTGGVVFVGDESSVGLAVALRAVNPQVRYVFEAGEPEGLTALLDGLGLAGDVVVVGRGDDRSALLREARAAAADGPFDVVVTGDAATVHAVRRDTRGWDRRPGRVVGKAYWAEGRTGLD